ncbi:MAG: TetR/AcrR family transcriptional regulator [Spirochaetes bacterium]|nr:TetR/AcrR family transcriptional regulator [Spirochaetota bacterium]
MNDITTLESIRKLQIIGATLKKISEIGVQYVTLDDIAMEAGLSKGGIAYYYASKELLIREAFREFFDRIFQRSRETMDRYMDPLDKLLSFEWLYNWNDPEIDIGYSMLFDCMSMAGHDADFQKMYHEWVENWISLLVVAVRDGAEAGEFAISDIDGTARAVSSIYHGIATRWYLDKNSHSTEWAVSYAQKAIRGLLNLKE